MPRKYMFSVCILIVGKVSLMHAVPVTKQDKEIKSQSIKIETKEVESANILSAIGNNEYRARNLSLNDIKANNVQVLNNIPDMIKEENDTSTKNNSKDTVRSKIVNVKSTDDLNRYVVTTLDDKVSIVSQIQGNNWLNKSLEDEPGSLYSKSPFDWDSVFNATRNPVEITNCSKIPDGIYCETQIDYVGNQPPKVTNIKRPVKGEKIFQESKNHSAENNYSVNFIVIPIIIGPVNVPSKDVKKLEKQIIEVLSDLLKKYENPEAKSDPKDNFTAITNHTEYSVPTHNEDEKDTTSNYESHKHSGVLETKQCNELGALPPKVESGCCGRQAYATTDPGERTSKTETGFKNLEENAESSNASSFTLITNETLPASKPTEIDQFPWVVRVKQTSEKVTYCSPKSCAIETRTVYCGGTLISSRYVLTAAHCFLEPLALEGIEVDVGEYDTRNKTDCVHKNEAEKCSTVQTFKVEEVIKHPEYFLNTTYFRHDIAILRLSQDVPYTEFVRPICLPNYDVDDEINNNTTLLVSGWGDTELSNTAFIKQFAVINLLSRQKCQSQFFNFLDEKILCASGHEGQGTLTQCKGDTGGPVMMYNDGQYSLAGIVSMGGIVCTGNQPSLHTNVFNYLNWIKKNMHSNDIRRNPIKDDDKKNLKETVTERTDNNEENTQTENHSTQSGRDLIHNGKGENYTTPTEGEDVTVSNVDSNTPSYEDTGVKYQQCNALGNSPPKPESGCCGRQVKSASGLGLKNSAVKEDSIDLDDSYSSTRRRRSIENESSILPDKYIYEGENAEVGQFPWIVQLKTNVEKVTCEPTSCTIESQVSDCGGALISSRYVLTAAHCIAEPLDLNTLQVIVGLLGEYKTKIEECGVLKDGAVKCSTPKSYRVDGVVKHPDYFYNNTHIKNDIAVLSLNENVPYTEFIRPICLPTSDVDNDVNNDTPLLVSGWGGTGSAIVADIKKFAVVNLLTTQKCRTRFYPFLDGSVFCATGRSGQGVCKGDSGGPVMMYSNGQYTLVGIVSSGASICNPVRIVMGPDLYTNVFNYMEWIQRQITR